MSSPWHALEKRLRAVEARLAQVEGGPVDTRSELCRASVRQDLRLGRVLAHLGIDDVSDEDVDTALSDDPTLHRARTPGDLRGSRT